MHLPPGSPRGAFAGPRVRQDVLSRSIFFAPCSPRIRGVVNYGLFSPGSPSLRSHFVRDACGTSRPTGSTSMKPRVSIRLFGRFSLHCADEELLARASGRAKEIFGYLAVNRSAPVSREFLAGLISGDASSEKSRKVVRQALWNLRVALVGSRGADAKHILKISGGWVELLTEDVWVDLAEFERAAVRRTPVLPESTPHPDAKRWAHAIELYRGDLLQGWYQDWCMEERERLRQIYLETLDALIAACESQRDVNSGVAYAIRALHSDPARECTHRALMRLYCLSGDRAGAVRQYEQCEKTLGTELGIEPDDETKALYRSIRSGHRHAPMLPAAEEPLLTLRSRRGKV